MSIFKGPDLASEFPNFQPTTSVLKLYAEALQKNGDDIAMIEGQTGKSATFREFLQKGSSVAAGLRGVGVTAGDYVIICCDKSITAYSAILGIVFTGATAIVYPLPHVDIVPKLTMGYPIKAVICDPEFADPLKKSMKDMTPQPVLFATTDPKDEVLRSLLTPNGELEIYDVKDPKKHIPFILYSSGTTGDPKGVQITDLGTQHAGKLMKRGIPTSFIYSCLYWLSGLTTFTAAILNNFKVVISNSTDPKENLALIEKYKVGIWIAGTGTIPKYINEPTLSNYDISSLLVVGIGGEVLVSSVAEAFRKTVLKGKAKMFGGLASTEGGFLSTGDIPADAGPSRYGLCGKPLAGVEIKIVDDEGNIVPLGKLGHVWVKSPGLTVGYWGRPELNKEVFDRDGFFQTGDVGFFDTEGELYLRGRVGDLVNFRGEKVAPSELEDILMSHEAVVDAAVVGKPHPTDIQHLTAYVVLKPGSNITQNELQDFVDRKVPENMKLRGGVHFLEVLPRTIIGKVKRKVLREI